MFEEQTHQLVELQSTIDQLETTPEVLEYIEATNKFKKVKEYLIDNVPSEYDLDTKVQRRVSNYTVNFSGATTTRKITNTKAVHDVLGDAFYEVVNIPLKEAEKYLSQMELDGLCEKVRGRRRLTIKKG